LSKIALGTGKIIDLRVGSALWTWRWPTVVPSWRGGDLDCPARGR